MGTPNSAYITIVVVSGVLNMLLFAYAHFRRLSFSGTGAFKLLSLASSVYSFGFALELASDSLEEIKRWITLEYVGMPFIPPLSFILVIHYVGLEKWFGPLKKAALFAIPTATTLLVFTNDAHHLFYRSVYLREGTASPMADVVAGDWYLVHGGFSFACAMAAVLLLLRQWRGTRSAYRGQLLTMLGGVLLPLGAAFLYLLGLTPNGMDPVPAILSLTSMLYLWSIFTTDLLTVAPIAKEAVFESMRDGVLVLDAADRLVDYNQAATRIIPFLDADAIGSKWERIWSHGEALGMIAAAAALPDTDLPSDREIEWTVDGESFYYRVRSSIIRKGNGVQVGRMIILIDVTEQRHLQNRLQRLAYYDGLSGIYNRSHFLHLSRKLLGQARDSRQPLSFILFDIDLFKRINDTYGHHAGDEAIRHVVSVASNELGDRDVFGRYGGEEFVVCLPSATAEQAFDTAERIREAVAASPLSIGHETIALTASFGVAGLLAPDETLEALLHRADQALYDAKRNGRNRVGVNVT